MATSKVTPNSDELVSEIQIDAPPERVFQALVSPEQVVRWWGQRGIYCCEKFEADLRVGGKWRSSGTGGDGQQFEVHGEILEFDPPRRLTYSWISSWTGTVQTTVRWELEPSGEGTLLRIRHCGLAAHPELAQSYSGWPRMLGWLQAYIERNETVEQREQFSVRPK